MKRFFNLPINSKTVGTLTTGVSGGLKDSEKFAVAAFAAIGYEANKELEGDVPPEDLQVRIFFPIMKKDGSVVLQDNVDKTDKFTADREGQNAAQTHLMTCIAAMGESAKEQVFPKVMTVVRTTKIS